MKPVWIAIHRHEYGETCFVFQHEPTETEVEAHIQKIGSSFEPYKDEYISICGPEEILP